MFLAFCSAGFAHTEAHGTCFETAVCRNPQEKPPSRHIHIYIFSKDMLGGWQIGLLLEIHIGVCLMVSITQFKYTMVGRFEHTMLIQQQRPLLSCLLKANCTCYALARGTQLLLTALPNWFWLHSFRNENGNAFAFLCGGELGFT